MKKFLLGTTALVATVFSVAAQAEGPTITLGGNIGFQAGWTDQDAELAVATADNSINNRNFKFRNDTEIDVLIDGKTDAGLGYGAVISLEADITESEGEGDNANTTYIYLESNLGRAELGSNEGAVQTMKVDASSIARATGGIDGDFQYYVTKVPAAGTQFIYLPELPTASTDETENANKISYYSPRFSGFQVGVSYTPDSGDRGSSNGFTGDNNAGQYSNVVGLGVNWEGQWDQVGIKLGATGEFGESEVDTREDLAAWQVGGLFTLAGFSVAGSYGDWSDSGLLNTASDDDQNYYTAGVGYETGPFGLSVTYLSSESGANEVDNIAVGADYQLAPGLVPYVEANFFDFEAGGAGTDNDGTLVLVGTNLSF